MSFKTLAAVATIDTSGLAALLELKKKLEDKDLEVMRSIFTQLNFEKPLSSEL